MRQLDLSATAALAPTRASAPTAAAGANPGNGFGSVFRQVQGEVEAFIEHGSTGRFETPALSPEGRAHLERSLPAAAPGLTDGAATPGQQQFLSAIKPWAEETGQKLGVAPELVAAHAALESGWGRHPLRQPDGSDTHNLFGLKAGGQWQGAVTANLTTEYEQGAALQKTARFRSYPDQASAFRDYAQVLLDNPRYRAALGAGGNAAAFAQGLARGGYATDPAYADKLTRLAQRLQRTQSGD
ncbi:flagellar protein FlgJ [Oxalobacteraceae bacterium GrIS 1.11]